MHTLSVMLVLTLAQKLYTQELSHSEETHNASLTHSSFLAFFVASFTFLIALSWLACKGHCDVHLRNLCYLIPPHSSFNIFKLPLIPFLLFRQCHLPQMALVRLLHYTSLYSPKALNFISALIFCVWVQKLIYL